MVKTFLHLFILTRIKKNMKTEIVDVHFLKENIGRVILRKGGVPSLMVKYVIEDMIQLGLIERVNKRGLYKILDVPEEKKILQIMV